MKEHLKAIINVETRFGCNEIMFTRMDQIFEAVKTIPASVFKTDTVTEESWNSLINQINTVYLPIIRHILPFMKLVNAWVQLLASYHMVTISLVLIAVKSFETTLDKSITDLTNITNAGSTTGFEKDIAERSLAILNDYKDLFEKNLVNINQYLCII